MIKQKVIAVIGPSASGKTNLSIQLAKKFNGEIISVDSRQIYKELDIGSAKPSFAQMQGIKHHLIDVVDITQEYTVADFCDNAKIIIKDIISRGKLPILAGGTGLYFRSLLQDFDIPRVEPDFELRKELQQKTNEELYKQLETLDYDIAQKIHPNNTVKIIRALEVCIKSGIPMSQAQKRKKSEFDTVWIGLNALDREFLYDRINKRVDLMIEQGLIEEAKNLFNKYGENKILTGTIGYQEFLPYIKGNTDLDCAINILKQNTRRYAKRQITWFKANKEINWFDIKLQSSSDLTVNVIKFLGNYM